VKIKEIKKTSSKKATQAVEPESKPARVLPVLIIKEFKSSSSRESSSSSSSSPLAPSSASPFKNNFGIT